MRLQRHRARVVITLFYNHISTVLSVLVYNSLFLSGNLASQQECFFFLWQPVFYQDFREKEMDVLLCG